MSVATSSSSKSKSGGLESVKYYVFDGENEERWNEYSIKTLAFAESKGWSEGLISESASKDSKTSAKNYLTMSLTGKAFRFVNQTKTACEIWEALKDEYAPTEEEDRYELEQEFKQCMMESNNSNPTDWFNMLDQINARFSNIENGKFMKSDEDMKLHIRMNLPEELYSEVITSFKDYSTMSLRQVKKDIKSFYRRMKRADKIKEEKSDKIMQVETSNEKRKSFKPRWKKPFKGKCHYCGEQGHKAIDCPKRKSDNRNNKSNVKANIKCFICGKNHYANQCPLRKGKEEEANVFIGVTHLKKDVEKNHEAEVEYDESQEVVDMNVEECKVEGPTVAERVALRKEINDMSHKDRIMMVNKILSSVGADTLFVYDKFNPHVEKIAQQMLDDWVERDYEVLNEEYRVFTKENASEQTWKKVDEDKKQSDDAKQKSSGQLQSQGNNYYDSLSDDDEDDDEDSSQSSFEITEQRVKGLKTTGEENSDGEIEEYDDSQEHVNATMHWNNLEGKYVSEKPKKKRNGFKQYRNNQSHKSYYKKDLKSQWMEMKKKMDELVEQIGSLDVEAIRDHTNQIDKICSKRDNVMRRKYNKRDVDRKMEKELRKAFVKPASKKKYWINSVNSSDNESWLADSGASVHVTNSSKYLFNVIDDNSSIIVGTGKETEATKKGELMLIHADTKQKIHLKNVLYVPTFKQNIMSIPTLMRNGFSINAKMKSFELVQNKRSIKLGKMDEKGMFYFVGKRIDTNQTPQINVVKKKRLTMDVNEAHDMFNHLGPEALRKTCKNLGIELTGTFQSCPGCMYAKAKQKKVNKLSKVRATEPGERLFIDTSGPYPRSLGGNIYWLKIVDDFSRKNWNFLMKNKSEVTQNVVDHIESLTNNGKKVKFIRCDNAGEHNALISYCEKSNINLEMTTPNTPQHNGVVERSFATELNYIRAMLFQANFTPAMISSLWGMAVLYLERTKNMSSTSANEKDSSPNLLFDENNVLDTDYLQPFGRMGFVTIRTKMKRKLAKRSFKAFMVGKPNHHVRDSYYMYNPKTRKVIVSRDIRWAPFSRPKFEAEMDGILNSAPMERNIISDDDKSVVHDSDSSDDENMDIFDQGGRVESESQNDDDESMDNDANEPAGADFDEQNESKSMQNALKKLNSSLNPNFTNPSRRSRNRDRLRSSMRLREVARHKNNSIHAFTNELSMDDFSECVFSTATNSDPNTPTTIKEALDGSDSAMWDTSVKSEVNNFLKRKSWKYVSRDEVLKMGRKLIPCKWVFKIKHEIDNSLRYKTRLCVKGFHQVPGVDFTESFSPVASGTTIVIVLLITLWNEEKQWICEMFDVEAAFLNAELEIPMYLEWPDEMRRLGFISEEEEKTKCIKLIRSMYGNVDAALRWMKAFVKLCISEEIGCEQSAVDPCLLFKKDEKGNLILLIAVYVDDVLIAGRKEDVDEFKNEFKKTYKITELGDLKRHLGIWFEWIKSDSGEKAIRLHMDDMATKIVKEYEKLLGNSVKVWNTPGYPSLKLAKPKEGEEIVDEKNYRSMVGKVMYFVNKVCPVCLSITRELAKCFACPTQNHWKALTRLVGYIKGTIGKGRLLRKPKEMRIVAFTDSDYANGEDRKSVTGGVVTLGGVPTNAMSKTQAIVSLSSTEAEYIALSAVAQEVIFQSQILDELIEDQHIKPSVIFEDNLGAIYLTKNSQISQRTKHIDVRHHFIRSMIENKVLDVKFVKSRSNASDIMTKNVVEELFLKHEKSINGGMIEYNEKEMVIEDEDDILAKTDVPEAGRDGEAKREDVGSSGDDKNIDFVTEENCLSFIEIVD